MTAAPATRLRTLSTAELLERGLSGSQRRKKNQYDRDTPSRRDQIFAVLVKYAKRYKGAIPIQRRSWMYCYSMGVKLAEGTFSSHWKTLKLEGKIAVDDRTGTPYIPRSQWTMDSTVTG